MRPLPTARALLTACQRAAEQALETYPDKQRVHRMLGAGSQVEALVRIAPDRGGSSATLTLIGPGGRLLLAEVSVPPPKPRRDGDGDGDDDDDDGDDKDDVE